MDAWMYETWKEQGRPRCPKCDGPVLYGYMHKCRLTGKVERVPEPKDNPV